MTPFYAVCVTLALYAAFAIINDDKRYGMNERGFHVMAITLSLIPIINIPIALTGIMLLLIPYKL